MYRTYQKKKEEISNKIVKKHDIYKKWE